jgi:hypothetical protein
MEENKNIQEEKQGCKMPRDLKVGISMVLTLLEGQANDDFMTKVIMSIIKEEAVAYENHQDLTKLVAVKSIMMSIYDAFADALALLKDTPCVNGVADFKVGDECDNN